MEDIRKKCEGVGERGQVEGEEDGERGTGPGRQESGDEGRERGC
jgi:hypothetical protein